MGDPEGRGFEFLKNSVMRGDPTGKNQDKYSKGVTAHNVTEYVTQSGKSNRQVQPVGERRLNAFGGELGNVWKMSSDLYNRAAS